METLKKYFPLSFRGTDVPALIVSIIIYLVIDIVCGVVIGILALLPIIGFVFALLGSLVGLYALAGIVIAILYFVKVLK